MVFNKIIQQAIQHPKKLFLLDALGASISTVLLVTLLIQYQTWVGIPLTVLQILAVIPLFFAIYDLICYRFAGHFTVILLMGIAVLNVLYCAVSLVFAGLHYNTVTGRGWTYIVLEIVVILLLSLIEYKVAKQVGKGK